MIVETRRPYGFAIKLGAVAYGGKAVIRAATPVPYGGKPSFRTGLTSRLRRETLLQRTARISRLYKGFRQRIIIFWRCLLIGEIDILGQLYGQVLIPEIVQKELADTRSPDIVQTWIQIPPKWLIIQRVSILSDDNLNILDPGERDAIILAEQQKAHLVIIDDLLGRRIAQSRGLRVTGLLGVLDEAARQNLLNFPSVIAKLQKTTFRASSKLIQALL